MSNLLSKGTAIYILILLLNSSFTFGQDRDTIKERKIEEQLYAIDSTAVSEFKKGTVAFDAGNYLLADSLYTYVYHKAPTFDVVLRRLGSVKILLGNFTEGVRLCDSAVSVNRSSANIITLASNLLSIPEENQRRATEKNVRAIHLLQEGETLEGSDPYEYKTLIAQAALQLYNIDVLKKTTKELQELYPEKMATHYYAAIIAAEDEDFLLSENEILKAKELGLSDESVTSFLDSGIHTKALMERAKKTFLWVLAAWVVGLILLFAIGSVLSNYTLKTIEREFKEKSSTKMAHVLRSIYGVLINTAGVYYYISLPIILILVVAMVIGLFYLFLIIGRIPIQLMLVLVIGACFTIYGMIRSLILKIKYEDPGRELKPHDAPALYELTKEVAKTMGTRPIDEIRITPETDLAVYELGSWREKMRDNGKRILIIGIGVLKDFKQNDFKSILAHEYGHFSHRDTAGGEVALRVRNDIRKYYISLFNAGQAVWWNLAFQFIRLYDFIYRRISNGATRLQEILADRVAAQTYGAQSFENGLTYVIQRNVEFIKLANNEIEEARKSKRPFNNLYDLSDGFSEDIEKEVTKALNRETTNEDTHPSPVDRFRFVKGLGKDKENTDDTYVRDLFKDWHALTIEMTKSIEETWKNAKSD